jgi:hypothetical protein
MAKDTFYFSHDYEPTSDPKIIALIGKFGATGYGIYWRLIEMLHSDTIHKLPNKPFIYDAIAQQMSTPVEQLRDVVKYMIDTCELLSTDKQFIWSDRVFRNINLRAEISEKRSAAGRLSAEKRATLAQQVSTSVKQNPTKKEKKEKKEKKSINTDVSFDIISELEINKAIEFVKLTKQKRFTVIQVNDFWKAFVINNEGVLYLNRDKKVNHFRNWLKDQETESKSEVKEMQM